MACIDTYTLMDTARGSAPSLRRFVKRALNKLERRGAAIDIDAALADMAQDEAERYAADLKQIREDEEWYSAYLTREWERERIAAWETEDDYIDTDWEQQARDAESHYYHCDHAVGW